MNYGITQHTVPGTRSTNQDRAAYAERDNGLLMVVADGLGGYAAGGMAAQTLIDTLVDSFQKVRSPVIDDPAAFLVLSISLAHSRVNRESKRQGITDSHPRTTCVACLVQNGYAYWAHVGDSRLYHFRGSQLISRTTDHSTTDPMYQDGILEEKESMEEAGRLVRCIGGPKRPEVTLGAETRLEQGDVLLLCTDGIWRAFTDREMEDALDGRPLEDSIEWMIDKCARTFRVDCDNMTALAMSWQDPPSSSPPVHALSIPDLDQEKLWRSVRRRSGEDNVAQKDDTGSRKESRTVDSDNIEATIAEIESFVDDLERLL